MTRDPPRLTVVGATEIERRLLDAVAAERPSPEITRRMALALGFSVPGAAPAAPTATAAGAPAHVVRTSLWAWTWASAGVLAVAVSASVIGIGTSSRPAVRHSQLGTNVASHVATPNVAPPDVVTPDVAPPGPGPDPISVGRDLHGEIAVIDAVRASIQAGAPVRALALLRRYDLTYPAGVLRPEAAALRIETLARSGQTGRARALARAFLANHPESPLRERVARIAGVAPGPIRQAR